MPICRPLWSGWGELRLGIEAAPAPIVPGVNEVTTGKGFVESKQVALLQLRQETSGAFGNGMLWIALEWNYFATPTSSGSESTGDYNIPIVGGSFEVSKRFDFANYRFFIEPQAQIAGVWENGMNYAASNGLRVHGG